MVDEDFKTGHDALIVKATMLERELKKQRRGYDNARKVIRELIKLAGHPDLTCKDDHCQICSILFCPDADKLHYQEGGCPSCANDEEERS